MEVIVFWLMPVVLLVVLILLVLVMIGHQRTLRRLTVIEPLGWLVKSWQVARFEPNNQTLAGLFKVIASSNLSKGTLLEQIIVSAAGSVRLKSKAAAATLVEHQSIGPLAEQFVLRFGAKKQSVLIGPLEQIEGLVDDDTIAKFRALSQKSAQNGYLALTIATSFLHGDKPQKTNHQIEGTVVLESSIDQSRVAQIQKIDHDQARFLTVLPFGVAMHLYGHVFPNQTPFGLNAKELETLLPPKYAEADLEKAAVVGAADIVARHQTLRVWQQKHSCVVVSVNPEDRDLPISPQANLT
ncbi:MAG: hypothetical protein Q8Q05_01460 [bacterium]|nr:hypothetical protein [bacterium]